MKIGGITPFTTIDYPGALAAVLFCQGCSLRCSYCHNPHLHSFDAPAAYEWRDVLSFLEERRGFIDAVVFSGGEPLLQPHIKEAIKEVKALGLKIGLHTSGVNPTALKRLLPLVDWVGMDVKAPFEEYERITQVPQSGLQAKKSAQIILQSPVAYEFRTTIHPDLLSNEALLKIARKLFQMGARHYALQQFRSTGCENANLAPLSTQSIWNEEFLKPIRTYFPELVLRD